MKKPNSRTNITNDLNEIVSLSRNMKHVSSDPLTLETFFGNKRKLSLHDLFSLRELSLQCLTTKESPRQKHICRFDQASDLGPLVQYFSWNDNVKTKLYLGDTNFSAQVDQFNLMKKPSEMSNDYDFFVSESYTTSSISLKLDFENISTGTIIDFTSDSNGTTPNKIFGMNIPITPEKVYDSIIEVFYITPQEGHKSFDLARELIESYSQRV